MPAFLSHYIIVCPLRHLKMMPQKNDRKAPYEYRTALPLRQYPEGKITKRDVQQKMVQPQPPAQGGSRKISFNVSDQYDIQDVIGEGAYGVVW